MGSQFQEMRSLDAGCFRRDGGVGGRRYCGGRLGFGEGRPQLGDVHTFSLSHPDRQRGIRKD